MDHSPSEQLSNDESKFHTTAIALSEGSEISELARDIAALLLGRRDKLKKWSNRRKAIYRPNFVKGLEAAIKQHPVHIFAQSCKERLITKNKELVLRELHLAEMYEPFIRSSTGVPWVKIGPFTNKETKKDHYFEFPEARAVMLLWISHFLCRCHLQMFEALRGSNPDIGATDWFLYIDRFPGSDDSISFFNTVIRPHHAPGAVGIAHFVQSDSVETDLLADNLAGFFNDISHDPALYPGTDGILASGHVHWEKGE